VTRGRVACALLGVLAAWAFAGPPRAADAPSAANAEAPGAESLPDGAALYAQRCAGCHETSLVRHARRDALQGKSANYVLAVLEHGKMRRLGAELGEAERVAVAEYFAGRRLEPGARRPAAISPPCDPPRARFDAGSAPAFARWGRDAHNTRFVPESAGRLRAEQLPALRVAWAVGLPETTLFRSQPAVGGGAVFVGSQDGTVYALDEATGCTRWAYQAPNEIRTGIALSEWKPGEAGGGLPFVVFGDAGGNVHAVDAASGHLLWMAALGDDPSTTLTGAPSLHAGRLFAPISSLEDLFAIDPGYACCTHQGAVVALDAGSGRVLWRRSTIDAPPKEIGTRPNGAPIRGPAGASVWNTPTVDAQRHRIYFGTGNNYTRATSPTSDSIFAVEIETGAVAWVHQATGDDAWNGGCLPELAPGNCPPAVGPDHDFGAPPILLRVAGRDLLVAGAKSGVVRALDPADAGRLLWKTRVGRGGSSGGVHFGMAADGDTVYVPVYDPGDERYDGWGPRPGLTALRATTGEVLWSRGSAEICGAEKRCSAGISAPVTAIPGAVLAAFADGRLRAFAAEDGRELWSFDMARRFPALEGEAQGGVLASAAGPVVANGRLFVGGGHAWIGQSGNALVALAPDGAAREEAR
jgi:polyvinyl alcohol dehydrogenase (cytochrome)